MHALGEQNPPVYVHVGVRAETAALFLTFNMRTKSEGLISFWGGLQDRPNPDGRDLHQNDGWFHLQDVGALPATGVHTSCPTCRSSLVPVGRVALHQ